MNVSKKRGRPPSSPKPTLTSDLTDSDIIDLRTITTSNTKTAVQVLARKGPPQEVKAIVDPGSAFSFVSSDLARDLGLKPDSSRQIEFLDVNGNRTTSAGRATVLFVLSGEKFRTVFHVAPEPPAGAKCQWRMIIGTNVFAAAKMIVDYERKEIYRRTVSGMEERAEVAGLWRVRLASRRLRMEQNGPQRLRGRLVD